MLAEAADFGPLAAVVMSATTFGGSAQFAAVSVLDAGGSAAAAIGAAILLNARYAPISISIGPAFEGPAWRRFLEAQLIVDESWAISSTGPGQYSRRLLVGAGLLLYAVWVSGTAVGAVGASFIGDPERFGLDAAFPALFLALLVGFVRDRRSLLAALLAAAIALVLVPVSSPGVPILAASAVCLLGLSAPVTVWIVVAAAGAATFCLKAVGPVLLGGRGRSLPPRVSSVITLLAPTVLAALVATQVFGGERELVIDARLVGIGAAALAIVARLPILFVVAAAAAATAVARLVA